MKFAAFCVVLALSACSPDRPVGPSIGSEPVLESSGKVIDLDAIGGLLKGRWLNIYELRDSDLVSSIWILEVRDFPGEPNVFEYDLARIYDARQDYSLKEYGEEIGGGAFNETLTWEFAERGKIRPYSVNDSGHIIFDRIFNDLSKVIEVEMFSSNQVVIWDSVLKIHRWQSFEFSLGNQIFLNCEDYPESDICLFDYGFE